MSHQVIQKKLFLRYRPEFVWTALSWMKTSPALYRVLQTDGLLTLPTMRYLKRISSSFSLETGLSTGVISYLKTRCASLSQEQKSVVLMIDEVLVSWFIPRTVSTKTLSAKLRRRRLRFTLNLMPLILKKFAFSLVAIKCKTSLREVGFEKFKKPDSLKFYQNLQSFVAPNS